MHPLEIRKQAESLRRAGKTYGEIRAILEPPIPKSTFSDWCSAIELSGLEEARLQMRKLKNEERGRFIAHAILRKRRQEYLASVQRRTAHLPRLLKDKNVAKIALGMLYLGEGSKSYKHPALMLGNSDPGTIGLFLGLLRHCYVLEERKFRCTLQCRADQEIKTLEKFWSEVTNIPLSQFYSARVDPRTVGKLSQKPDYKGVCRINYFSADIFYELMEIGRLSKMGP